jgi:3-deoxy-manno-octulosonate cytidylyltransferase (CMP-KDO synthetase)
VRKEYTETDRTTKVVGLIPARYHSTRFEGKPLALIAGIPMIQRVYNQCIQSKSLASVIVLTDSSDIYDFCYSMRMNCLIVDEECLTGTDRCAKGIKDIEGDVFVNIQGDEPLINPEAIDQLVESHTLGSVSNAYVELDFYSDKRHDNNVVKVVTDSYNNALYYSRLSIPYMQKEESVVKQQLGLYAFNREFLEMFPHLPVHELEKSESVEMLRFVENGFKVKMVKVEDEGYSVDTPEDLVIVENILRKKLC